MKLILLLLCTAICIACVLGATALMILDKPWYTWTLMILLGIGALPKVRIR